jgi:hypothetical protein
MNKLTLLPLLVLPACSSLGDNAQRMQAALDHDHTLCVSRGNQPGTPGYTACMVKFGHADGYLVALADDGNAMFALSPPSGIPANPTGGVFPRGNSYPRGNPQ